MKDFCIIAFDKQKKTMKLAFNMLLFSTICNSIYDCLKKKKWKRNCFLATAMWWLSGYT